jgi:predicted adenylyl cyclase CyaB
LIIEIKARCPDLTRVRDRLLTLGAEQRGTDRQVDTYFRVAAGRLKLRQGDIENQLIFYVREEVADLKTSRVVLYPVEPAQSAALRELLAAALGVWREVGKSREIFFIENVKFHLDRIDALGTFVEIEAIDETGAEDRPRLQAQCDHYLESLEIPRDALIAGSYSDLLGAAEGDRRTRAE